jgi:hypothetical protein
VRVVRPMAVTAATAVLVLTAGCASGDESSSGDESPSAAATGGASGGPATLSPSQSPPATAANVKVIAVAVAGGKVTPALGRVTVSKGQTVKIVVTTDKADEVHVHGYEKEAATEPGSPTVIELVADQTGTFEVETHESNKVLFLLQVQ